MKMDSEKPLTGADIENSFKTAYGKAPEKLTMRNSTISRKRYWPTWITFRRSRTRRLSPSPVVS
jgi:hypothetical protein